MEIHNERTIHTPRYAGVEPAITCIAATNATTRPFDRQKEFFQFFYILLIRVISICIALKYPPTTLNDR